MNQSKFWKRLIVLGLSAALLLSGCGGGDKSGGSKSEDQSSASSSTDKSEGPKDLLFWRTAITRPSRMRYRSTQATPLGSRRH